MDFTTPPYPEKLPSKKQLAFLEKTDFPLLHKVTTASQAWLLCSFLIYILENKHILSRFNRRKRDYFVRNPDESGGWELFYYADLRYY